MNQFLVFVLVGGVISLWYYLFRGGFGGSFGGRAGSEFLRPRPAPVNPYEARERAQGRLKEKRLKVAPITGACQNCGKKTTLPFRCKYCGDVFCDDHRLPEAHKCDGI